MGCPSHRRCNGPHGLLQLSVYLSPTCWVPVQIQWFDGILLLQHGWAPCSTRHAMSLFDCSNTSQGNPRMPPKLMEIVYALCTFGIHNHWLKALSSLKHKSPQIPVKCEGGFGTRHVMCDTKNWGKEGINKLLIRSTCCPRFCIKRLTFCLSSFRPHSHTEGGLVCSLSLLCSYFARLPPMSTLRPC